MDRLDEILSFAPDGKLEKLCPAGLPNLLLEWDHEVDLGGKGFRPAGWDECFPTIDPTADSPVMGDLIGLAPSFHWQADSVEQIWRCPSYEAKRRFLLRSPTCLDISFRAINRRNRPLEFLWASHALFNAESLVTVRLPNGIIMDDFLRNGSERKEFIANTNPVELVYSNFRAVLTTDQPWWGIWLNLGGWPAHGPSPICLGLEATNTPAEQPDGEWLQPGAAFSGTVRLDIQFDSPSSLRSTHVRD